MVPGPFYLSIPRMLESSRLILRPWRESDKRPFAVLNADPDVMRHFPRPLTSAESDALADQIIERITRQGWGFWAVERKLDGRFMGFTGLHSPEGIPFSPCMEVGWRLARPFWGYGYATEAARLALDVAFNQLGEHSVVAFTALSNTRSQAVMHRLGMVREAEFEHPALPEGHRLRPHVLFRLVATCGEPH